MLCTAFNCLSRSDRRCRKASMPRLAKSLLSIWLFHHTFRQDNRITTLERRKYNAYRTFALWKRRQSGCDFVDGLATMFDIVARFARQGKPFGPVCSCLFALTDPGRAEYTLRTPARSVGDRPMAGHRALEPVI